MKTTKKHASTFMREVKKWVNNFGLTDWEFYLSHKDLPDDVMGLCCWDTPNRVCYIQFCKTWDNEDVPLTKLEIRCTAFHEVMHNLLGKLHDMAMERKFDGDSFDGEIHSVIKNWQNLLIRKRLILP